MTLSSTVSFKKQCAVRSGNGRGHHAEPTGSTRVQVEDADVCYAAALRLVEDIDRDLQKGTRHFYDVTGKLLLSLDEVVQAILTDSLVVDRPSIQLRDQDVAQWPAVGEMVA
jgi:hypothetical protein